MALNLVHPQYFGYVCCYLYNNAYIVTPHKKTLTRNTELYLRYICEVSEFMWEKGEDL